MPELHSDTCPACRTRPRGNQAFCGPCTSKVKVSLTDTERWLCERLPAIFRDAIPPEELPLYEVAADKLAQGKQPTLEERLAVGAMCWALGKTFDSHDLQDKDVELLYRKLMLHDRRTKQQAPFPLL